MSFEWDSIKVVNNPELKEIEALFTPISSLGGIESPNEDGSPNEGGGEDGGGNEEPVIVDCTPPQLPSKCRQYCLAMEDLVLANPTKAESFVRTESTNEESNWLFWKRYNVTNDKIYKEPFADIYRTTPGLEGDFCGGDGLYVARNLTEGGPASSIQTMLYEQSALIEPTPTPVGVGERIDVSGSYYLYFDGRDPDGTVREIDGWTMFASNVAAHLNETVQFLVVTSTGTFEIDNTGGNAIMRLSYYDYDQATWLELFLDLGTPDMTGGYLIEYTNSWVMEGTKPHVENWAKVTTPSGASLEMPFQSGGPFYPNSDYDSIRPQRDTDKSYTRFFTSSANALKSPRLLYAADGSDPVFLEQVKNALERSKTGNYVSTDPDCLAVENWVKPEGCPDCVRPTYPNKCVHDCDGYKASLSDGITMGTLAELDALYSFSEGPAADIGGGVRYIDKTHWSSTDGTQGLPTIASTYFVPIAIGTVPAEAPCASDLLSLKGISGGSNFRLTCATAADYEAVEHPGPVSDNYTLRDHLNASTSKAVRALVNPIGDQGAFHFFTLSIPTLSGSGARGGYNPNWTIWFDRTAGTIRIEVQETYIPNTATQTIPWDGSPVIDINLEFSLAVSFTYQTSPYISRLDTAITTTGTINGTAITALSPTHRIDNRFYQEFMGNHPYNHMGLFETSNNDQFNLLAISTNPSDLDDIKVGLERSFPNFVSTDPDCITIDNWVAPDGCSEVLCPEDDGECPCYCGDFTIDPLTCEPEGYTITGGFYPAYSASDANGVFPNYNGTYGRLEVYKDGAPYGYTFDTTTQQKVFHGGQLYYLLGLRSSTGINNELTYAPYNFVTIGSNIGTSWTHEFEASVLCGYVDIQSANEPEMLIPDNTGSPLGGSPNAGGVRFEGSGTVRDQNGDGPVAQSIGLGLSAKMERRGPSTVAFTGWNKAEGQFWREVTLPPSVLDPSDKFVWFSFKSTIEWEDLGETQVDWPMLDSDPNYNGYRMRTRNIYYVNGVQVGHVATSVGNAGYYPDDDWAYFKTYGLHPDKVFSLGYQTDGVPHNGVLPGLPVNEPSNMNGEMVYAWMDIGPGAANLPNTTLGKNLSRINDTYVAPDSCNNCGDTP